MDQNGYSLSDLAAIVNNDGFGGSNGMWLLIILFFLGMGGNGLFGRTGELGQYATAASQQEILFGQQFQNIDNKIDRIGNGIADSTFALNNAITNGTNVVASQVVAEGRNLGDKMCELKTAVHNEGEATRAMIQGNKIEELQAQVTELKNAQMFCGIPRINPYGYGVYPYANNGCGCNQNI